MLKVPLHLDLSSRLIVQIACIDVSILIKYSILGEAYSATGNIDEAEKWYKESLKSKPDHLSVHLTYAKHLAKIVSTK